MFLQYCDLIRIIYFVHVIMRVLFKRHFSIVHNIYRLVLRYILHMFGIHTNISKKLIENYILKSLVNTKENFFIWDFLANIIRDLVGLKVSLTFSFYSSKISTGKLFKSKKPILLSKQHYKRSKKIAIDMERWAKNPALEIINSIFEERMGQWLIKKDIWLRAKERTWLCWSSSKTCQYICPLQTKERRQL